MWTILKDTSDHDFTVFNHMHFPESDKSGDFKQFKVKFAESAPSMDFTRHAANSNAPASRNFNIISTDYGSFMIGATCRDDNLAEGADAKWDYVAMTRDKAPSKFMR